MSVDKFIRDTISDSKEKDRTSTSDFYVMPDIPVTKLKNAIANIALGVDPDYVIAICDSTIFGAADTGCVFLGDRFYMREILQEPVVVNYADIINAEYKPSTTKIMNDNKKVTIGQEWMIHKIDGTIVPITTPLVNNRNTIVHLINGIVAEGGDSKLYKSTIQTLPLAAMEVGIKKAYIKLVCNYAYSDDETIDSKEYSEIASLVARIDIDSQNRLELREYMLNCSHQEPTLDLLNYLKSNTPGGCIENLTNSLLKDILFIYGLKNDLQKWASNEFIKLLQHNIGISDSAVKVIIEALKNDEDILKQRKNDSEIEKAYKEIAAKAAAVGVPLAGIYFSGSVIGMSAAGITSGLAALGMGGLLGFSSMVTGIGVVVLIGVGAYKIIKNVSSDGELEKNTQREYMLQIIIKNSNKALNNLVEDINEISTRLEKAIKDGVETNLKIEKIAGMVSMLSRGAQSITGKISYAERESIIIKLPEKLDINKIKKLKNDIICKKYYEFIISCYEEKIISKNNTENIKIYKLIDSLPLKKLVDLIDIFEKIEYKK